MAKKKTAGKKDENGTKEKRFNNPLICEIYEIYEKGKMKIKKACGNVPEHHANKKEIKREDKILRNTLIILVGIFVLFFIGFYINESGKKFEFREVEFERMVDDGGIVFYHTDYSVVYEGNPANYNVWLRKDPRQVDKRIPFEGEFSITDLVIVNLTDDFSCQGYGSVAMGNVNQVLGSIGIKMGYAHLIQDENLTAECDEYGRYTYIEIKSGEESKIIQTGPSCYDFVINNCEMLDVTERFLMEILERVPKEL